MFFAGRLSEAESILGRSTANQTPAAVEMRDLIGRLRLGYPLDVAGLQQKLLEHIPDVTTQDIQRWIAAKYVGTRNLDGKTVISHNEPGNLFRLCTEAKERRITPGKTENPAMRAHLQRVIESARRSGQIEVEPVHHRVHTQITVPKNARGMKSGARLRVWLPMAQEYRQQKNVRLIASSENAIVADNGVPHRTIYFERTIDDPGSDQIFYADYEYTSYAYYPNLSDDRAQKLPDDFPAEYLADRPPHISLTEKNQRLAREIVGAEKNPLTAARKIFHWNSQNVTYLWPDEYCLVPSLGNQLLDQRRGDCGMQALGFIILCRSIGIPARWQSGWQSRPGQTGMHDWCEFYVAPWGWLPCDPSYGVQKSDDSAISDFYFGHQDAHRLIVNLDYGRALTPPKHSLRSEPADFQRGEVEIDGQNLYFDQWRRELSFQTTNEI